MLTLAVMDYLRLPDPTLPKLGDFPLPTMMLIGGVALGVLLAVVCRLLVQMTARRRAAAADKRLRAAVHDVAIELVVDPIRAELQAHADVRAGLARALK